MDNTSRDNETSISRDYEFEIQLSIDDINKIDEEMNDIPKSLESKSKIKIMNTKKNQITTTGLMLLNVCMSCEKEFIPKNSMINEKLCKLCLEK